ncbi:SRPBCC domain-containing protein [Paenibacillus terreus]|uniref:SRPBCC domain-containing protein n=1 Tax=Paenibacillus terreus TaxID=1387834 RepID=A0ABV5BIV7_9BACL
MMTNSMMFKAEGQEIIAERIFNAPRELVFRAFTEAEHLKKWWGPRGWELTVCNIDFRPGGIWHYCMKCMDENQGDFYGFESWAKALFSEIVDGEKIVYTDYFSDAEGNTADNMPSSEITLTFIEQDGKTKVVNRAVYPSADAVKTVIEMGMQQGFTETWDRLAEYVESVQ